MPMPFHYLLLTCALIILSGGGCQSRARLSTARPVSESSVQPGVNKEYLKPELQVGEWVERLERESREIYAKRHEIVQAARIRPGTAVADIGAGTGLFIPLFAQAVGPRGKVYAVDIVPAFLGHIRDRAAKHGLSNVVTMLATERSVGLPKGSIDLAFVCDVYHHFEFPQSSLASIYEALRPGGELVVVEFRRVPGQSSDWVFQHVRAGQEEFTAEIERAGFKKIEQMDLLKENYMLRFRKTKR